MTSSQKMEHVYSYNPGACTGHSGQHWSSVPLCTRHIWPSALLLLYYYKMYWLEWRSHSITVAGAQGHLTMKITVSEIKVMFPRMFDWSILNGYLVPLSFLTLLFGRQEGHMACKKLNIGLLVVTIWLELCTSYSSCCHHHLHHP